MFTSEFMNTILPRLDRTELGNLMAAMRGPDVNSPAHAMLKTIITARLRGIVFERYPGSWTREPLQRHGYAEDVRPWPSYSSLAALRVALAEPAERPAHFVSHLWWAVDAVIDHPVWGGLGPEVTDVLRAYVSMS